MVAHSGLLFFLAYNFEIKLFCRLLFLFFNVMFNELHFISIFPRFLILTSTKMSPQQLHINLYFTFCSMSRYILRNFFPHMNWIPKLWLVMMVIMIMLVWFHPIRKFNMIRMPLLCVLMKCVRRRHGCPRQTSWRWLNWI